jgi:Metal-dependent hydrolases of the beta-lactamase superfamily III
MLNFIGRGSAFNHKEGNNSAFYIENRKMILIDCGETTFSDILELNLLDNIDTIDVLITHTHPDHFGSLGSLIFYFYFMKQGMLNIIVDKEAKHKDSMHQILLLSGVKEKMFQFLDSSKIIDRYDSVEGIAYVPTSHYEGLDSYGIYLIINGEKIYFSGDTNSIEDIKRMLFKEKVDKIYVDTISIDFEGNPHLALEILEANIPLEYRKQIHCMHINSPECELESTEKGFNVVKRYKK